MSDVMDDDDIPAHVRKVMQDAEARDAAAAGKGAAGQDYEVGYGKPPKASQFVKGQPSANPKGRPRKNKRYQQLLLDRLYRKMTISIGGKRKRLTSNEVVIEQLVKKAVEGDFKAILQIMKLNAQIEPVKPLTDEIDVEALAQRRALTAKLVDLLEEANTKPERPRRPPPPIEPDPS